MRGIGRGDGRSVLILVRVDDERGDEMEGWMRSGKDKRLPSG